jgi:endonuclease YncB( thermonuclease family)
MPQQGLSQSVYNRLLAYIEGIYRRANAEAKQAVNLVLVKAYWEIGKRIVTVEQQNKLHARYGAALLENLSKDLTRKYGSGFSPQNLRRMRLFYNAYPIRSAPSELDWTHYQILSTIEDKKTRELYERRAVKEDWTSRELAARLREDGIKRVSLDGRRQKPSPKTSVKLEATRGRLYTYAIMDVSAQEVFVDCGFNTVRKVIPHGTGKFAVGAIVVSAAEKGTYTLTSVPEDTAALYAYKAEVRKIIDADTLRVKIDLGFDTFSYRKLRLRGIDCPEIGTAAGRRVKRFVEKILQPCLFIIVKTYKDQTDKYDRYLADVYFKQGESDPAKVAAEGEFLNQRLLDEGYAVRYEG